MREYTMTISGKIPSVYSFTCRKCGKDIYGNGFVEAVVKKSGGSQRRLVKSEDQCREECRTQLLNDIKKVTEIVNKANQDHAKMDIDSQGTILAFKKAIPDAFTCPVCGAKQSWFPIPKRDLTPAYTLKKSLLTGGCIGVAVSALAILIFNLSSPVPIGLLPALFTIVLLIISGTSLIGQKWMKVWDDENARNQDALQGQIEGTITLNWVTNGNKEQTK